MTIPFKEPKPAVRLVCDIYHFNGVSRCRSCGAEWVGEYRQRDCQRNRARTVFRSFHELKGSVVGVARRD